MMQTTASDNKATPERMTELQSREVAPYWLSALIESADDAIISKTLDGIITSWNKGAERVFGYTAREVIGRPVTILIPPDHADEEPQILARLRRGERIKHFETVRVRKDGTRVDVSLTVSPIRGPEGEIIGASKIARDITERKRAQEERERFFSVGTDLLVIASFDGYFKWVSPAWERTFGWKATELTAHPWLYFTHPEDQERTIKEAQKLFEGHETVAFENRYRRQDGSYRWLSWNARPYPQEQSLYCAATDITERKRAEEEIRQLNEALERRVAERTAALEAANKELESFSYSVSHDLRAPLRAIDGFSQALLEDYAGKLDEGGTDYLQRVCAASRQMAQLIDALLQLSRITRSEMSQGAVDLSALARGVAADLGQSQPERQVTFRIADGLVVRGDGRLLRVVMENLIRNAWKFTARREEARIEFGVARRDGKPVYFVRDNGAGFDMAYAGKLFGAFQRLHGASEFEGTGIGLATVQRIIHRHGGEVWAEGAVGEGATFYFTL